MGNRSLRSAVLWNNYVTFTDGIWKHKYPEKRKFYQMGFTGLK